MSDIAYLKFAHDNLHNVIRQVMQNLHDAELDENSGLTDADLVALGLTLSAFAHAESQAFDAMLTRAGQILKIGLDS